ncbi:hypothetical protein F0562_031601 [Nyssa sinensis]|uniref:Protein RDM1 n=1 Tax=Nyssa sinensis TaxID=561372 RepID=A0A5J5AWM2_9ASTE|nr:hypothetical protein F0562_031601 [Nyssa sinensis]
MLRTYKSLKFDHLLVSDSETESDDLNYYFSTPAQKRNLKGKDEVSRQAQMYQDYMKEIEIPNIRDSAIPFNTWQELANSLKQIYGQPLHYFTKIQLKQWDQSRMGAENEQEPMDKIINPSIAEATIWFIEDIHRRSTSYYYLAKVWLADPIYHAFIDPVV